MLIPIDVVCTFLLASVVLALAPGPDNIFVLTQSALYGRLAGIFVVLGLCSGLIVHTCAVALGVAVIFQTSAFAFTLLKVFGASYLVYLAYGAFRAKPSEIAGEGMAGGYGKLYMRGIVMNVTNPKVSIFFLAFLPQFADPARGTVSLQIVALGFLFMVATVVVFGAIALLAGSLGALLRKSEKIQNYLNKFAAVVFLGLALKLAMLKN